MKDTSLQVDMLKWLEANLSQYLKSNEEDIDIEDLIEESKEYIDFVEELNDKPNLAVVDECIIRKKRGWTDDILFDNCVSEINRMISEKMEKYINRQYHSKKIVEEGNKHFELLNIKQDELKAEIKYVIPNAMVIIHKESKSKYKVMVAINSHYHLILHHNGYVWDSDKNVTD